VLPTIEPWKIFVNCRTGYLTTRQLTIQYAYAHRLPVLLLDG